MGRDQISGENWISTGAAISLLTDDIVDMMISNEFSFDGVDWQPFLQGVRWKLPLSSINGDGAKVYVRFKDENGNETSGVELGQIIYAPEALFLPIVPTGYQ